MNIKSSPKQLLDSVVRKRRPDVEPLLDIIGKRMLTEEQRWLLQDIVSEEFADEGLRDDSEPNRYGLELEDLLDWITTR